MLVVSFSVLSSAILELLRTVANLLPSSVRIHFLYAHFNFSVRKFSLTTVLAFHGFEDLVMGAQHAHDWLTEVVERRSLPPAQHFSSL